MFVVRDNVKSLDAEGKLQHELRALKMVKAQHGNDELIAAAKQEIYTHKIIPNHKNIVQFIDSGMGNEKGVYLFYTLMELCPVSVFNLMEQRALSQEEVLYIFRDVAAALVHLHEQQPAIAHRDLKVENW